MGREAPDVLIIDKCAESREVLRTILRRDGVKTVEALDAAVGLDLAKNWHPRVWVLDSDTIDLDDPNVCDGFCDEVKKDDCSVVVLGGMRSPADGLEPSEIMPKPYHYAPLIRKIEELLRQSTKQM